MKIVRQLIIGTSVFIAAWVGLSFIAVMLNTGNADFWTTSLVWSLLACIVVMPGLVIAHHANERAETRRAQQAVEEQTAFIDEAEQEGKLWPSEEKMEDQN
jgi:membrane protein implicated in regulation of membrane protease activity